MYETLPSQGSIRLVRLCESEVGTISLVLTVHELSYAVPFIAFSYTWGSATRGLLEDEPERTIEFQTIQCNGKAFSIRQNLFDALCQVSDKKYSEYFWIDAICVNQDNIAERNAQVALMGELYKTAEEVYVWLGKDEAGVENVVWATEELLPAIERIRRDRGPDFKVSEMANQELGSLLGLDDYMRRLGRYFAFTHKRTWFQRAWTLQEVVNSRYHSLHCGQHELSWEGMFQVEDFVGRTNWHHLKIEVNDNLQVDADGVEEAPNIQLLVAKKEMIRRWTIPSEAATAASVTNVPEAMAMAYGAEMEEEFAPVFYGALLFNTQSTACTDPRDKVYSRFGILRSCFPGHRTDMFLPDYNMSTREVYYQTAKAILENSPLLTFLGCLDLPQEVLNLPSWVPQYERMGKLLPLTGVEFDAPNFHSHDRSIFPRHVIEGDILRAHGFCFDTITVPNQGRPDPDMVHFFLLDVLNFCRDLADKSVTGDDPLETYWRARIFNQDSSNASPASGALRTAFRAYLASIAFCALWQDSEPHRDTATPEELEASAQHIHHKYFSGWASEHTQDALPSLEQLLRGSALLHACRAKAEMTDFYTLLETLQAEASPWQALTVHRSTDKACFKTETGLLGLTQADDQQPADEVWCITTSLVPLILRPLPNGQRQVVAQAYLHGFMRGEMLHERWGPLNTVGPVEIV